MGMIDIYKILHVYTSFHKPSTLLISFNVSDFGVYGYQKQYDTSELRSYYTSSFPILYHLPHFNLKYYAEAFRTCRKAKRYNNQYFSLLYDKYGGVSYDSAGFMIDSVRWNDPQIFAPGPQNRLYYAYLDSIAAYCSLHQIKLVCFQSPVRSALLNSANTPILNTHISLVKAIVLCHGHSFANAMDRSWDDNLFVDAIHLNARGAEIFTQYCFDHLIN
jgi:hypothetical protein